MTLQKMTKRYRSAYRVGRFVNELGILAKVGAVILFIAPTYLGIRAADAIRQYAPVTQRDRGPIASALAQTKRRKKKPKK